MEAAITALVILGALHLYGVLRMSAATDRLSASANALSASVDAAVSAIQNIPAGTDDAAINAVSDQLDGLKSKLDAVVTVPSAS